MTERDVEQEKKEQSVKEKDKEILRALKNSGQFEIFRRRFHFASFHLIDSRQPYVVLLFLFFWYRWMTVQWNF